MLLEQVEAVHQIPSRGSVTVRTTLPPVDIPSPNVAPPHRIYYILEISMLLSRLGDLHHRNDPRKIVMKIIIIGIDYPRRVLSHNHAGLSLLIARIDSLIAKGIAMDTTLSMTAEGRNMKIDHDMIIVNRENGDDLTVEVGGGTMNHARVIEEERKRGVVGDPRVRSRVGVAILNRREKREERNEKGLRQPMHRRHLRPVRNKPKMLRCARLQRDRW